MRILRFIVVLLFLGMSCLVSNAGIRLSNLKVEYEDQPLGLDVEKPRFSWQMVADDDRFGYCQKAYQIVVSDESGHVVWDTGKTDGDESLHIDYSGSPLKSATRYFWSVRVWDQEENQAALESSFETGLMSPDEKSSLWSGAQWIGSNDLVLYTQYLSVYRIDYTLKLDKSTRTTRAGFVYGANDSRLMDKNKNIYHVENQKDQSYLLVELDISGIDTGGNASLNIYRAGYHPEDRNNVPFMKYEIPERLIDKKNRYDEHTVSIRSVFGYTHIYVNGYDKNHLVAEVNLNPLGRGGDFIAFPVLGDIGFHVPAGMKAYFSTIEVKNYRSPANALFSDKDVHEIAGGKDGILQVKNVDKNSVPMIRTLFKTDHSRKIEKARLYVTSRGIYEVYINGKRVGNDYFNPGLSQYNKTHFYQTYDVTSFILPGKNAVGALLGEGWWSGGATYTGEFWNFFGDRQSLLAKLVITYSDGGERVIVTNPDTWKCYNDGPFVYGSFFQGEVYDARKEIVTEGWTLPDYDDEKWQKAVVVPLAGNISTDSVNIASNMPMTDGYDDMRLVGNIGASPGKIKELTAISVKEVHPGVFVYDMGQNMVGVPKIKLSGYAPGTKITMRFAEVLYPDLPEYKGNTGMLMLENIRAAMAQDIYITKGGEESINPRFTFHGYRYVEITGIPAPLPVESVKGEVISSVHRLASYYETSNPDVNKLWENMTWSTYGNFLSIPTDCPQRNERMGWSGDISVFSRTATYLADVQSFLSRHLTAMRDVQREDGRFTDVAPLGGGFGGILWGSAGITVAWESFQQYNDKRLLETHYDAMKRYIKYLLDKNIDAENGILVQENPGSWGNLGDWLSPEDNKNDRTLLWEAYFIYDLELMGKIASVLDKQNDAEWFRALYAERKEFFNRTYIDAVSYKTMHSEGKQFRSPDLKKGDWVDTQTSYVLPIVFDLLNENNKEKVTENFVKTVQRENIADNGKVCPPYSLMTGFIGTAWINRALSDVGRTDVAYDLLQQTTFPSWLYSVKQGATTIWERLNSYTHTDGFGGNNGMNSFNHYSFGAIGSWMYNYSLGIERDEDAPGFKHFILKPEPDPTGKMTFAKGHYDSMYGRIESSWENRNGFYHYQFTIPANTTATLYLEALSPDSIMESGIPVLKAEGLDYLGMKDGKCVFNLKSGKYNFSVRHQK
ncbi:MAG: glycoside hydrolase family 78 protein [Tannerella sp.]|jgi:alpha-L-rhamnosidase|nr:glycoside hydrolase family 78 protein [Tannerella sp.]